MAKVISQSKGAGVVDRRFEEHEGGGYREGNIDVEAGVYGRN